MPTFYFFVFEFSLDSGCSWTEMQPSRRRPERQRNWWVLLVLVPQSNLTLTSQKTSQKHHKKHPKHTCFFVRSASSHFFDHRPTVRPSPVHGAVHGAKHGLQGPGIVCKVHQLQGLQVVGDLKCTIRPAEKKDEKNPSTWS